jgi:hypothetical protein
MTLSQYQYHQKPKPNPKPKQEAGGEEKRQYWGNGCSDSWLVPQVPSKHASPKAAICCVHSDFQETFYPFNSSIKKIYKVK